MNRRQLFSIVGLPLLGAVGKSNPASEKKFLVSGNHRVIQNCTIYGTLEIKGNYNVLRNCRVVSPRTTHPTSTIDADHRKT